MWSENRKNSNYFYQFDNPSSTNIDQTIETRSRASTHFINTQKPPKINLKPPQTLNISAAVCHWHRLPFPHVSPVIRPKRALSVEYNTKYYWKVPSNGSKMYFIERNYCFIVVVIRIILRNVVLNTDLCCQKRRTTLLSLLLPSYRYIFQFTVSVSCGWTRDVSQGLSTFFREKQKQLTHILAPRPQSLISY